MTAVVSSPSQITMSFHYRSLRWYRRVSCAPVYLLLVYPVVKHLADVIEHRLTGGRYSVPGSVIGRVADASSLIVVSIASINSCLVHRNTVILQNLRGRTKRVGGGSVRNRGHIGRQVAG